MPSHTSADLQPLDVAVFRSVKSASSTCYRSVLLENFQDGRGMTIDYWDLPNILNKAWILGATKENCISGFRATGIWPRQNDWVEKHADVIAPSIMFFKCDSSSALTLDTVDDDDLDDFECAVEQSSAIPSNMTIDRMMNFMSAGVCAQALVLASTDKLGQIAQFAVDLLKDECPTITQGAMVQALESGSAMLTTVQHVLRIPTKQNVENLLAENGDRLSKKPKLNGIGEKVSVVKILNSDDWIAKGVVYDEENEKSYAEIVYFKKTPCILLRLNILFCH